ncbi:MAG: transcription termination/antitermination protein NusG [Akkermansia sp.]|nr:transcription termination/antitermination protein NusG [Akkermansia sp.]
MSRPLDRKAGSKRLIPEAKDQWYVLHVLSNKERRSVENLNRLFKEDEEMGALLQSAPLVPTEKVEDVRNGKKYIVERKLYPGYVYLNFALRRPDGSLNNDAWYKIQAVDGVISFACGRNKEPLPMSKKDVEELMAEIERRSGAARPKVTYTVGEEVVVLDGAFAGEHGVVEMVDAERGRLRVGVTMFGRSNPLDLDYTQVARLPEDEKGSI